MISKSMKKKMAEQLVDFEEGEYEGVRGGSFEREINNLSLNLGSKRPKKILTKGLSQQI